MNEISNINVYNDGMRKSLLDKIWFLSKIGLKICGIYDYGCADGSLLGMIHNLFPDLYLEGYDFNPEMIELAKTKIPNVIFESTPRTDLSGFCVNASSVFHEIHAYSSNPAEDYDNIFGHNAEYIAIRDMFYSETACHTTKPELLASIYQHEPLDKIKEFETFQGPISDNKNFLQYLLTYKYVENWEREVRENYFPHSLEQFLRKIPADYRIVYIEHYTLPYLRERVLEDFGFTLVDATHAKILLKRA